MMNEPQEVEQVSPDILNNLLTHITDTLSSITLPLITDYAFILYSAMVTASFSLLGLQMAANKRSFDVEQDVTNLIIIGAVASCLREFESIVASISDFAITVGTLGATSDPGEVAMFKEAMNAPSQVVDLGISFLMLCVEYIGQHDGFEILYNLGSILLILFTALVVILVFCYIAYVVLAAQVNFWIAAVFSALFVPLIIYKPTEQYGKTAIMGALTHGVKFMIVAFMVAMSYTVLSDMVTASELTLYSSFSFMISALILSGLLFSAGKIADSILQGTPTVGGGDLLGGVIKAGVAAGGALVGGAAVGLGAKAAAGKAAGGGSYLAGGGKAAVSQAKQQGASGMQQAAAGIRGAASVARSGKPAFANIRERFSAGHQAYHNRQGTSDKFSNGGASGGSNTTPPGGGGGSTPPGGSYGSDGGSTPPGGSYGSDGGSTPPGGSSGSGGGSTPPGGSSGSGGGSTPPGGSSSSGGGSKSSNDATKNLGEEQDKPNKDNIAKRMVDKASGAAYTQQLIDQATPQDDNPRPVNPPKN
jgi:type IV secretory pathway TrbL component